MKHLKITLCLVFTVIMGTYAQEKEQLFFLDPEEIQVYGFATSTKGSLMEYEFEDDYTVKLTNKVYKINLVFEESKSAAVRQLVTKILDGTTASSGYENMIWKKKAVKGKPMYSVELKDNKLKIQVFRKYMNSEAYDILNTLGQEFVEKINS